MPPVRGDRNPACAWEGVPSSLAASGQVVLPAPCLSFPSCAIPGFALGAHNNMNFPNLGAGCDASPHSSPQPPAISPVLGSHGKAKSFLLLFTLLPAARRSQCPDPGPQQAGVELGIICAGAGAGAVLLPQLPGSGGPRALPGPPLRGGYFLTRYHLC